MAKEKQNRKNINFYFNDPDAENVFLLGDFNGWHQEKHPMKINGHGIFEKTIKINPGRYEYKFLVDGQWKNDPENLSSCANCFGTLNNILVVS